MALAFVPVLVRELGSESYGLIGIYVSLQSWLVLVDMGLRPTLIREMAKLSAGEHSADSIRDLLRSAEIIAVVASVSVALLIFAASPWLSANWLNATTLSDREVAHALMLMGCVAALQVIETMYSGSIAGAERQVLQNVLSSFTALLRGAGGAAVVVYYSSDINSFFEWQLVVALIGIGITGKSLYAILPKKNRPARFSFEALKKVKSYAGSMALITVLVLVLTQIDKLVLAKLLPLDIFGHYVLATAVASALFYLSSPIVSAYFPRFVRLALSQGELPAARITYHTASQLVTVAVGSAGIVLSVLAQPLLKLWTNNDALAAEVAPLVTLLAVGYMFNGIMSVPYHLQLAHGWTTLTVKINFFAAVTLTIALFYFVPSYGAIAGAGIWCVLNLGYVIVGIWLMHRRLLPEEKWTWYIKDTFLPLAGMLISCVWLAQFLPGGGSRVANLFGITSIWVVTVLVGVLLTDRVKKIADDLFVPFLKIFK